MKRSHRTDPRRQDAAAATPSEPARRFRMGTWAAFAAPAGFVVLCAMAWPTSTPSTATEAAPGSPLYEIAVIEALAGLRRSGQSRPEPRPCPQCGQIHASPQDAHAQGSPPPEAGVPPAGAVQPSRPAASDPARAPLYRYCPNCLIYHPAARTDPGH